MSYVSKKISKKDLHDYLTEIRHFRWVIAACQCRKVCYCVRLAIGVHYAEFRLIIPRSKKEM